MTLYHVTTSNFIQKTLNAQLVAGVTASATLNNVTSIQNLPGVMIIDRIDTNGTETPSKVEVISFTGTSGSTVTTLGRGLAGTTDQDHEVGAIVEFGPDIIWAQGIMDALLTVVNDDGTIKKASGAEVTTGTEDAKIVTPKSIADAVLTLTTPKIVTSINDTNGNEVIKTPATTSAVNEFTDTNAATGSAPERSVTGDDTNIDHKLKGKGTGQMKLYDPYITDYVPVTDGLRYYGMARQAIINGNFDVWQRGTTVTNPSITFLADRYKIIAGMGTPPSTIVHSRQILTAGELPNSYYYYRINVNGAGTGAANDYYYIRHPVEHGTRNLAGNGKKVTLSFWAKSDIANKRIGIDLRQNYGTTGSPTSEEIINGTNWTLTSSWAKYTHTFTTNTLSGKTFGTDNNDGLWVDFWYVWNSTYDEYVGASTAETFVGSGNIDIAQVQLCAGDVALPFQPKSFEEELRACMRYYEKSYSYAIAPATATQSAGICLGKVASNTIAIGERYGVFTYKVPKRTSVTPVIYPYSTPTNTSRVSASEGGGDLGANSGVVIFGSENSFILNNGSGGTLTTDRLGVIFHYTADAEL